MGKKRLIKIGALIGCGLFFLALGLYNCWIYYFYGNIPDRFLGIYSIYCVRDHDIEISYDVLAAVTFSIGVFIILGVVITILGGLIAFKVKVSWWKIASILLLVSLFLPWWQWSFLSFSFIPEQGHTAFSAHNFLIGFLATWLKLPKIGFSGFHSTLDIILYLTPEGDGYPLPINGPWLNTLLVRVLCYFVFGLILSAGVLGWSNKKKRRLISVLTGCLGIVLFLAWISLAWSALDVSNLYYGRSTNPYFMLYPYLGYSFLSFGFFAAVIGIIILTVSLFVKDVEKTSNAHLAS